MTALCQQLLPLVWLGKMLTSSTALHQDYRMGTLYCCLGKTSVVIKLPAS